MQRWLFDVKIIFGGNGLYQCLRARDEQSGAVAERAHKCAGVGKCAPNTRPLTTCSQQHCASLDAWSARYLD